MSLSGTAQANTACQMIDNVVNTVSIIDVMSDPKNASEQMDNFITLEAALKQISVKSIQPSIYRERFKAESVAIDNYINALRFTAAQKSSTQNQKSLERLQAAFSPAVSRGLQSLNSYWTCDSKHLESYAAANVDGGAHLNASLRAHKSVAKTMEGTKSGQTRGGSARSKIGNSDRRQFSSASSVEPNYILLMGVVFLGLFSVLYFRRKRSRAREYRRIINRTIPVSLNKKTLEMILVDITRNGFKIEHAGQIEAQKKLRVNLNGRWHMGQIMWRNSHYAGVKFKRPINEVSFRQIIAAPHETPTSQPA